MSSCIYIHCQKTIALSKWTKFCHIFGIVYEKNYVGQNTYLFRVEHGSVYIRFGEGSYNKNENIPDALKIVLQKSSREFESTVKVLDLIQSFFNDHGLDVNYDPEFHSFINTQKVIDLDLF